MRSTEAGCDFPTGRAQGSHPRRGRHYCCRNVLQELDRIDGGGASDLFLMNTDGVDDEGAGIVLFGDGAGDNEGVAWFDVGSSKV